MKAWLLLIFVMCGCSSLGSALDELSQSDRSEPTVKVIVKKSAPITEGDSIITETPWHMVFGSDPNIKVRQRDYVGFVGSLDILSLVNLTPDTLTIRAFVDDEAELTTLYRGFIEKGFFTVRVSPSYRLRKDNAFYVNVTVGEETKIPKVILK
ncbi:MAG: hypothetical protein GTO29_14410 [Candidatus Latescibacteria bacterium]|nr:hypothetical protein [Candidatus Latescibacterota bacterium]NIO57342.1 hypothetical protein [Candidatus Latescibacterota bacterium]